MWKERRSLFRCRPLWPHYTYIVLERATLVRLDTYVDHDAEAAWREVPEAIARGIDVAERS